MKEVKKYRVENSDVILPGNKIRDYVLNSGNCVVSQKSAKAGNSEATPSAAVIQQAACNVTGNGPDVLGIKLLSVSDVRKILGIGKTKAYSLFKQKEFPSFQIGSKYYVREEKFQKWIDEIMLLPNRRYEIAS